MKLYIANIYILYVDIPFQCHKYINCTDLVFVRISVIVRTVLKLYYQIKASIVFGNMHCSLYCSLGLHNISETQYSILKKSFK